MLLGLLRADALFQFQGRDLVQRLHQRPQRLEILIARQGSIARQILVHHSDGAAYISYFMRNGRHQNSRAH